MSEALINELVEQIVRRTLLDSWLVLTVVSLIAAGCASLFGAYLAKRGEHLATKEDMNALLDQARATTEATQEVATRIQHEDWASKEWKLIRRQKLEALIEAAHACVNWIREKGPSMFFDLPGPGANPIGRVSMIAALYWREMTPEVQRFVTGYEELFAYLVDMNTTLLDAGGDSARRGAIFEAKHYETKAGYQRLNDLATDLEQAAGRQMDLLVRLPEVNGTGAT